MKTLIVLLVVIVTVDSYGFFRRRNRIFGGGGGGGCQPSFQQPQFQPQFQPPFIEPSIHGQPSGVIPLPPETFPQPGELFDTSVSPTSGRPLAETGTASVIPLPSAVPTPVPVKDNGICSTNMTVEQKKAAVARYISRFKNHFGQPRLQTAESQNFPAVATAMASCLGLPEIAAKSLEDGYNFISVLKNSSDKLSSTYLLPSNAPANSPQFVVLTVGKGKLSRTGYVVSIATGEMRTIDLSPTLAKSKSGI